MKRSLKDVNWDGPANREPGYVLVLREIQEMKQQLRDIKRTLEEGKECRLSVALDEAVHKTVAEMINERELP